MQAIMEGYTVVRSKRDQQSFAGLLLVRLVVLFSR
jgi:hypothetical protein